jgi:dipeptidyl aminopeptidase/acylaminoacyl peptidase
MTEKRAMTVDDLYHLSQIEDPQISPDGAWVAFVRVTVDKMENGYQRNIWLCATTDAGDPIQLTRGGKDTTPRWSPDGKTLAFVSARGEGKPQIYLLPVAAPGGEPRPLTSAVNGASSPAWSPDGDHIAFLSSMNLNEREKEDRGETDQPPADQLESKHRKERREDEERRRRDPYHMWRIPYRSGTVFLGDRYAQVYVMPTAADLEGDEAKPRRLTNADANHEPPQWSADGKTIYTTRQRDVTRDEPFLDTALYGIDVVSGNGEHIDVEGFCCFSPEPSPDGKWLAFIRLNNDKIGSLLEGITRLAVMPTEGGAARDLNVALDRSVTGVAWAADSKSIIFSAENEGDISLYQAQVETGEVTTLLSGTFDVLGHDIDANGNIAFSASTPTSPSELHWLPGRSEDYTALTEFNRVFLDEAIVRETYEMWFTMPSGDKIQGWYLLPVGYEEGKKYPLAVNIHGGPHVMWGPSQESMFHEWQLHAASGYVVFYCNPRGAGGYGQAFQEALHKGWGVVAYEDVMAGVDAMAEKDFVDENRMAVTGGSYGGYLTTWVVGHTERFKAAVSQRGVYSLISFYGTSDVPSLISGEFDAHPWEDHQLLWEHSPLAHAHKIKTPLLILHAENDYRVPIEQAEQLFAFVRRSGGTVEMWRYPRDGHELSRSGEPEHRVSRLNKMVAWFDKYCKTDGR